MSCLFSGSKCGQTKTEEDHLDYVAGYSKCLAEISHFLEETKPSNNSLKQDIVQHVSDKLKTYLIKDNKVETPVRKLPIPPLCKKPKELKSSLEEAIDLSVSVGSTERTNTDKSAATEVPKELTNHKPEHTENTVNQSAPLGLLCGGQVMLLVQLPQSVTSQVHVQNFQNINQSNNSIPMMGVQPVPISSQAQIFNNQTVCRKDQTLICPTPIALPQLMVTGNQVQNHPGGTAVSSTSDTNGRHDSHWRPW